MAKKRRRGPGAAQRMKARQLGIEIEGFTKPMLDGMNAVAKVRWQIGIGVVVQEDERARRELDGLVGFAWPLSGKWWARRDASARRRLWSGRLRECAQAVADQQQLDALVKRASRV